MSRRRWLRISPREKQVLSLPPNNGLVAAGKVEVGIRRGGAFYGTFVFGTDRDIRDLVGYSLAAGVSLRALLAELGLEVGLKWPNDICTFDRRKLAGVLIELVHSGSRNHALIGVGLNLADAPEDVAGAAALCDLTGENIESVEFAERAAPALLASWQEFLQSGFEPFRAQWLAGSLLVGEKIAIDTGSGIVRGICRGVSEQGHLQVEDGGAVVDISSGHVMEWGA